MIKDFESNEHEPMISSYLFNDFESKPIVLIDVPFCNKNEKVSKQRPFGNLGIGIGIGIEIGIGIPISI